MGMGEKIMPATHASIFDNDEVKTALVTGATGFIGSYLVRALVSRKFHVRVYSRSTITEDFKELIGNRDWITGELTDACQLASACQGVDIVFHAAGIADTRGSNVDEILKVNVEGTKNVHSASVHAGVRKFIYFSSALAGDSAMGDYAYSKRLAENYLCESRQVKTATQILILRPAKVYGHGMRGSLSMLIRYASLGVLPSLPEIRRTIYLVSVGDLCRLAIALAIRPNRDNEPLYRLVTDNQEYTLNRIEEAIYSSLGRSLPRWKMPSLVLLCLALLAQLANLTRVKKNKAGQQLYRYLTEEGGEGQHIRPPQSNDQATQTLEQELPSIIKSMNTGK